MNRSKIELFSGLASVFLIPFNKHLVAGFMLTWLIFAILNLILDKRKHRFSINKSKNRFLFMLFPIFYAVHLIGLIYTTNFDYAFFDLEIKLSMLLIPLTLWLRADFYADKQKIILKALIYGSLASLILNLIQAAKYYHSDPDISYFFYTRLSPIHPSYMALYVSMAILSVLYLGLKNCSFNHKYSQIVGFFVLISLASYLFLLSSKAGIITFTLALAVFIIFRFANSIKKGYLILIALSVCLIPFLLINSVPTIKGRFQAMINAVEHSNDANLDSQESSMERVAILMTSSKFAYQNLPWGVGTGDTKDEIIENYKKLGSQTINERYLNAHNQYLQTTISLGLLGILSLLSILIGGMMMAIKNKDIIFTSFLILIGLHFLFESMLEQQAGVIFITLFYSFFCIWDGRTMNNLE